VQCRVHWSRRGSVRRMLSGQLQGHERVVDVHAVHGRKLSEHERGDRLRCLPGREPLQLTGGNRGRGTVLMSCGVHRTQRRPVRGMRRWNAQGCERVFWVFGMRGGHVSQRQCWHWVHVMSSRKPLQLAPWQQQSGGVPMPSRVYRTERRRVRFVFCWKLQSRKRISLVQQLFCRNISERECSQCLQALSNKHATITGWKHGH